MNKCHDDTNALHGCQWNISEVRAKKHGFLLAELIFTIIFPSWIELDLLCFPSEPSVVNLSSNSIHHLVFAFLSPKRISGRIEPSSTINRRQSSHAVSASPTFERLRTGFVQTLCRHRQAKSNSSARQDTICTATQQLSLANSSSYLHRVSISSVDLAKKKNRRAGVAHGGPMR